MNHNTTGRHDHGHEQIVQHSVGKLSCIISLKPDFSLLMGWYSGWMERLQLPFFREKK